MPDDERPPLSPPPDLEEFCKSFGGLGNMTPERWEQWEQQNKKWQRELAEQDSIVRERQQMAALAAVRKRDEEDT